MELNVSKQYYESLDYTAISLIETVTRFNTNCGSINNIISTEDNFPLKRNPGANIEDWNGFFVSRNFRFLLKLNCFGKIMEIPYHKNISTLISCARYDEKFNNVVINNDYCLRKANFLKSVTNHQLFGYLFSKSNELSIMTLDDISFLWMILSTLLFHENLLNHGEWCHNVFMGWKRNSPLIVQRIGKLWHLSNDEFYPEHSYHVKDETLFFPVIK
ncbi:MAG: hypothetical protein KGI58_01560 [Patescibacteria group bacterium]|nr:hypothetical protein [Patescibacteria group bacterium]